MSTLRTFGRRSAGVTLVEMVVFIVIVSTAAAGVLLVMNTSVRHSADPMIRKQVLSVAESLMEEVFLRPFTYCDPDDENVVEAENAGACTVAEAIGPEAGETRYLATAPFDNVNDYDGFVMNGISDQTNSAVPLLGNYTAAIEVTPIGGAGQFAALPLDAVLQVTVTVASGNVMVALSSFRFRHTPNAAS